MVILAAAALFSASLATFVGHPSATAQTPLPSSGGVDCPEPSPSPSPSAEPTILPTIDPDLTSDDANDPEDPCEDDGDGKPPGGNHGNPNNNDGGGKEDPDHPGVPDKDSSRNGKNKKQDRKHHKDKKADRKRGKHKGLDKRNDKTKKNANAPGTGRVSLSGEFTSDRLQVIAAQLRGKGLSDEQIIDRVYAPFILAGPAAWTNTWGAPRYGPGPIVRTHEGQDVFCKYGDPVLATHEGEIEFDEGGLGGRVARLFSPDGSYFYYAHLSGWNTDEFKSGDTVQTGDVIGYCGNTGNAITTPPHVHFGWYQANGEARNPMWVLVNWLHTAERSAGVAFKEVTGYSIKYAEEETTSRLFGDSFAPDVSELRVSSDSLLTTGADAFGLAEAALQAALAEQTDDAYPEEVTSTPAGAGEGHSEIAEILESSGQSPSPTTDEAD